MARPLRIEYSGAIYHVTARGNAQGDIYMNDRDRQLFLDVFGQVCRHFNWCCHAYCLMGNHYHLVIETPDANLSKGMRQLNGIYTQSFNRNHQRVGHVFQGRYKAIMVDKDSYLLEVIRYVILNPVRVHITKTAGQWAWSSYHSMIGRASPPDWVSRDWVLSQFGRRVSVAQKRFIKFVKEGYRQGDLWKNLRHQIYLGDERFIEKLEQRVDKNKDLTEIPRQQRRLNGKPLKYYLEKYQERDKAIIAAFNSGQYTQKKIASAFGIHYSSVSKILKRHEANTR